MSTYIAGRKGLVALLAVMGLVSVRQPAGLAFDVGERVDNVTNHRNVLRVGHVVGTPAFGLPLDAAAGRSIRLWASLAR